MARLTDMELAEIKEAALKRKELLENIYDITSRRRFTGKESEIDEFVEYLDAREPYYQQLAELDKKAGASLNGFVIDYNNENRLYREVSQIITNAKDVAAQIVALDKENNNTMGKLHKKLMSEMKGINASKKARSSYNFFQVQSDGQSGR